MCARFSLLLFAAVFLVPVCAVSQERSSNEYTSDEANNVPIVNWEDTVRKYERLVVLDEDDPQHQFNLGYALVQLDQYSKALFPLWETARLDPYYWPAFYMLGACYYYLDLYPQAEQVLRRGSSLERESAYCNYLLGYVYLELDELEQARDQYFIVIEYDEDLAGELYEAIHEAEEEVDW